MKRALLQSAAAHGLLAAALVAWTILIGRTEPPPPGQPPEIELVLGNGAETTGTPPSEPHPESAPVPPAPTPVPPQVAAPDVPQPATPDQPPPPPQVVAPAPPVPPSAPPPLQQPPSPGEPVAPPLAAVTGPAVPPPPAPPAPAAPMTPPPPPPPPARTVTTAPRPAPVSAPSTPPTVRLGDGEAGPIAEILDPTKTIHRAESDTGNLPPAYPLEAARRGERGQVLLRLTVDADGHVTKVDVARSSGSGTLDTAARRQLATWRFKPARRDGLAVDDTFEIAINFTLD